MTARIITFTVFLFPVMLQAQIFPQKNYPKQYFTWPVQATRALAANFGELRPNHYHMGLDCKTDQKQNVPVIAAADGYVAKVKIEPYGFGRCIYINHPNGLTTLYAHLNDFYPALEKYIKDQQYKMESWQLFLENIPADLFPVKKGQFIAYSGNTGGSQGPHLHFEIRDTQTDKVLNPLLFGFPIQDNIPPAVMRLAVYDRTKSTYEQSPRLYPIKKVKGIYQTVPAVIALPTGKISFAITAVDRYTGSTNQNGIYEAGLYDNGQPVVGFQIDSISYDETRYMNAHIDFKLRTSGGPFVQHLSRLPGYNNGIYKEVSGDGVINTGDGETHQIKIAVKDTEGNTSVVEFAVRSTGTAAAATPVQNMFKPGYLNVFENNNLCFYLAENELYDSLDFKVSPATGTHGGIAYLLHSGNIPVHSFYPITIKNSTTDNPDRMVMRRWWGSKDDYAKAVKEGDWYRSSFKALGNVELYEDLLAPTIAPVGFKEGMNAAKLNRIVFVVRDETEELRNFRAELDGKWLRFSNDKGKTFIYNFDEHCGDGEHELKISVEDVAGNKTEKIYKFTR
ncbi:MAG: M23 family metallopeptidase [Chitinophagaceae bacterium]|nr:M23 family metallopeptidase [Chitinophagaceae bacterium]